MSASCTCGCGAVYADEDTAAAFGADHEANKMSATSEDED